MLKEYSNPLIALWNLNLQVSILRDLLLTKIELSLDIIFVASVLSVPCLIINNFMFL